MEAWGGGGVECEVWGKGSASDLVSCGVVLSGDLVLEDSVWDFGVDLGSALCSVVVFWKGCRKKGLNQDQPHEAHKAARHRQGATSTALSSIRR